MASSKINELKTAIGAGARVNRYKIELTIPATVPTKGNWTNADLLCKASTFPSMTVAQIEVFNQGRKLLIPGDTSYTNTWTVSFYNTADHVLRTDIISWMRSMDHFQNNTHSGKPEDIFLDLKVNQLDGDGNITTTYTFHNCWPTEVGEISVADESDGGIQEFDVTFSFTDWVIGSGELQDTNSGKAAAQTVIAK